MEDVVGGCSDFEGVVLEREGEEEEERVGFWRPEVFALAGAGEGERERGGGGGYSRHRAYTVGAN